MEENLKTDVEKIFERRRSEVTNAFDATDSTLYNDYFGNKLYKMNHASRGRAIIFNHKHFRNNYSERKGTETDVKNLIEALLKLGFDPDYINIFEDLKANQIFQALEKVRREDHTDRDMLAIFVLTHGGKNDNISAFDMEYSVENIWEPFTADKCMTLAGKPKLFFVIACRGDGVDEGRRINRVKDDDSSTEVDAKPIEVYDTYSIPVWSDFLYVFSTYKGYFSYRNVKEGTWYVQAFCNELSKTDITQVSFTDFLTAVNGRLSVSYETGTPYNTRKQIPIFSSTLTKQLYFKKNKQRECYEDVKPIIETAI